MSSGQLYLLLDNPLDKPHFLTITLLINGVVVFLWHKFAILTVYPYELILVIITYINKAYYNFATY